MLTISQAIENALELRIGISNHDRFGVFENRFYAVDHQS
jgi:hypothetical protein